MRMLYANKMIFYTKNLNILRFLVSVGNPGTNTPQMQTDNSNTKLGLPRANLELSGIIFKPTGKCCSMHHFPPM